MKQKLIVTGNAAEFDIKVNGLLADDWYYVPDTLKVNTTTNGERFVMLLIKDEEHDDVVTLIKQQMAGHKCQGQCHEGHNPPPFFQSPDEEPVTPDCNPGAK